MTKVVSNGRIKEEEGEKEFRNFKIKQIFVQERPSPNVKQSEIWNDQ